jgi:hypothetical protein
MKWLRLYTLASYLALLGLLISNYIDSEVFRTIFGYGIATWIFSYPIVLIIYLVKRPSKTEISLSLLSLAFPWIGYVFIIYMTYQMFDSMVQ